LCMRITPKFYKCRIHAQHPAHGLRCLATHMSMHLRVAARSVLHTPACTVVTRTYAIATGTHAVVTGTHVVVTGTHVVVTGTYAVLTGTTCL
jgi:hypothetical protein